MVWFAILYVRFRYKAGKRLLDLHIPITSQGDLLPWLRIASRLTDARYLKHESVPEVVKAEPR